MKNRKTPPTPDAERRQVISLPLALAAAATGAAAGSAEAAATGPGTLPAPGRQGEWATPAVVNLGTSMRHWLYLPPGYEDEPQRRWPLIVFLHGSGERGRDMAAVKIQGLPKLIDSGQRPPAIVVSPQCDEDDDWDAHLLHAMLLSLQAQWRIDPRRVTATGLSMGGGGCWDWAMSHPGDLAGIAPVCGYGSHLRIGRMVGVPVRAYHGDADPVVPLHVEQALVDELKAAGGRAEFTIYPGVGHDAWTPAYADPELLPWLLARSKT